jgi:signal transduction histidine kinase
LAFGVAHNFNNALTIIKGRTQLLQRLSLPENAGKNLHLIAEAVDDSASMIRRIRDFGRPRTAESFIRVDVAKLLDSVVEMVRPRCREQQVRIGWERGAPLLLQGDPGELKEVFVNIIYNALDALAGEGRITISTRLTGNNVELRFSDTGPGMNEEVRAHIFEPFFSTKGGKGTGLGLATCYSIINGHSGVIEVESEPGAGATFKITLPFTPAQTPAYEPELLVPGAHRHQEAALTV